MIRTLCRQKIRICPPVLAQKPVRTYYKVSNDQNPPNQTDYVQMDNFRYMQRGLLNRTDHAWYITVKKGGPNQSKANLAQVLLEIHDYLEVEKMGEDVAVIGGVNVDFWKQWSSTPQPSMDVKYPLEGQGKHGTSKIFEKSKGLYQHTEDAVFWFKVKGDDQEAVNRFKTKLLEIIEKRGLASNIEKDTIAVYGHARRNRLSDRDERVLGGRFSESVNLPSNPISLLNSTVIGFEDHHHIGGSYLFAQRLHFNWRSLLNKKQSEMEDMIGRKQDDSLIPTRQQRSHVKASHGTDSASELQMLRLGLPFDEQGNFKPADPFATLPSQKYQEKGVYFAGFMNSISKIEDIAMGQLGKEDGYIHDLLLENCRSDLGGFYYIPSLIDLNLKRENLLKNQNIFQDIENVDNYYRLAHHFFLKSKSPYQLYNTRQYMSVMCQANKNEEKKALLNPPSMRILALLESQFQLWRNSWYLNRKQMDLGHLKDYLPQFLKDHPEIKLSEQQILNSPILERKGWADLISLGQVFTSDKYGYLGTRTDEETGFAVGGAGTYHIHNLDIIVGGLPQLGLGQGRYLINYQTEEEFKSNWVWNTISEASGVGHVVPAFEIALEKGIQQMIQEANQKAQEARKNGDNEKYSFYTGVHLSLTGVKEYCERYAALAMKKAMSLEKHRTKEINNLKAIEQRMLKISKDKPTTFLEAAQLVFTLHTCIHILGEPTSLGRFDQYLYPFYKNDKSLKPGDAQEIVDSFFLKLGEKTLQNRIDNEDHQPYGNMAFGGASGPYPQGDSNNQWIQQLTVGGIKAAEGEPETVYNDLTLMALRASRRLPSNAPVTSLRTTKNMPDDVVEEAAKAILSGSPHPIFLNDDKFIPALCESLLKDYDFSPNKVSLPLAHARDYACDGCYEPQLSGRNWFNLGGFQTPLALECALNMGKTYGSAGVTYFRGQRMGLDTPNPKDIKCFDDLVKLYFEQFKAIWAKQAFEQMRTYGRNTLACPAPLLSVFTHGCMESGRDFYAGGPQYQMFAPQFTGLSTTINSLFSIKKMVFDKDTAVTNLPELVNCMMLNWGNNVTEPFVSQLEGDTRHKQLKERYQYLRSVALQIPKWTRPTPEVDQTDEKVKQQQDSQHKELNEFADKFLLELIEASRIIFRKEQYPTLHAKASKVQECFSDKEHPFQMLLCPGTGTFEGYLSFGQGVGASADGRLNGQTIASDLSASPSPMDMEPYPQTSIFTDSLKAYGDRVGDKRTGSGYLSSGAPTDYNIREDFPLEELKKVIREFANGDGSNLMTITMADKETFENARTRQELYDLVRVRMGGWTEFFISMFPLHHEQHLRRPVSVPENYKK